MNLYKVTSQGRITIPVELRKKYGINPSTKLKITDAGKGITLTVIKKTSSEKRN